MALCDPPADPDQIPGPRLQAILVFWLFVTTNDCFITANPTLAGLKAFDWTTLPSLTQQDRDNIMSVLDPDVDGVFAAVRAAWATVLTAGGTKSYGQSQEALGLHYSDHNCPASIDEIMRAFAPALAAAVSASSTP